MTNNHFPSVYTADTEQTTAPITRRVLLECTAGLLVASGIAAGSIQSANAAQKYAKADVSYQDYPKDGQSCANCKFWDGAGGCEIVEGEITADAWCAVWVVV